MGRIFKTAAVTKCETESIWDSWILVTHMWGTFDLVVFIVISRSFGTLSSKACASKMVGHRRKRIEIWKLGTLVMLRKVLCQVYCQIYCMAVGSVI